MTVLATFDVGKARRAFLKNLPALVAFSSAWLWAACLLVQRQASGLDVRTGLWLALFISLVAVGWFWLLVLRYLPGLRANTPLIYVRKGRVRYAVPIGVRVPVSGIEDAKVVSSTWGQVLALRTKAGVANIPLALAHEAPDVIEMRALELRGS